MYTKDDFTLNAITANNRKSFEEIIYKLSFEQIQIAIK